MKKLFVIIYLIIVFPVYFSTAENCNLEPTIISQLKEAGFKNFDNLTYIGKVNEYYEIYYVSRYIESEYNVKTYNALTIFVDSELKGFYMGINLKPVIAGNKLLFNCNTEYGNSIIFNNDEIPSVILIDGEIYEFQVFK